MILDGGRDEVVDLVGNDQTGNAFDHMAIGSGSTSASSTDTSLANETGRESATTANDTTDAPANVARIKTTFDFTAEVSNTTVREFGVVNASSSGVFLTRTVLAEDLIMEDGDKVHVLVDITYNSSTATHTITSDANAPSAVTTDGTTVFAARTIGNGSTVKTCALGSDTSTTPSTSDSALVSEITSNNLDRQSATSTSTSRPSTGVLRVETQWTSASGTSDNFTVGEIGVFTSTSNSSGTMISRYLYAHPLKFRATNTYQARYEVELV